MPTLVRLGNIKIQMFADDHAPAHFHVRSPTSKAVMLLGSLKIVRGRLTASEIRTVIAWAKANGESLDNAWTELRRR